VVLAPIAACATSCSSTGTHQRGWSAGASGSPWPALPSTRWPRRCTTAA